VVAFQILRWTRNLKSLFLIASSFNKSTIQQMKWMSRRVKGWKGEVEMRKSGDGESGSSPPFLAAETLVKAVALEPRAMALGRRSRDKVGAKLTGKAHLRRDFGGQGKLEAGRSRSVKV
jgi:hypothetical protein